MRIALVYPATEFDMQHHRDSLANGLLCLASAVETAPGRQVDIFDSRHTQAIPDPKDFDRYDVVGFTAMSMQSLHAIDLAKQIRQRGYRGRIVFGGPHATVATEHLKTIPEIDAIFLGEAEATFPAFLSSLEGKDSPLGRVWIRGGDGGWRYPGEYPFVDDLDSLPWPARHKFGEFIRKSRFINILTSRGCPFNCNFCQPSKRILFGKRVRRRSVGNIASEIEDCVRRFDANSFSIDDDTFTFDERAVLEFCGRIQGKGLFWSCQSRSDISRDTLTAMKNAGCWMMFVGVESGSQRMLDLMEKHNTVEANHRFIGWCNELGIKTWCNIILGYPGETEADMKLTLKFVDRAKPTWACVSQATPFPGTFLWERNREDLVEVPWDAMARHTRLPKFRSMAALQPLIEEYTTEISRGWERPVSPMDWSPPVDPWPGEVRRWTRRFKSSVKRWLGPRGTRIVKQVLRR